MQGVTKRNSLYFQLMILLVLSGAVALAVFYGLNTAGENVVYYYYNHSNYSAKREKNYVAELQSYVSSNELKSYPSGLQKKQLLFLCGFIKIMH